jgi:DNA-binding XRE family transcriptional regulator
MPKMSLAEARELLGWNRSELARRAGQSVHNIQDLEDGSNKNPSFTLVMKITDALRRGGLKNLQPEDLFSTERVA